MTWRADVFRVPNEDAWRLVLYRSRSNGTEVVCFGTPEVRTVGEFESFPEDAGFKISGLHQPREVFAAIRDAIEPGPTQREFDAVRVVLDEALAVERGRVDHLLGRGS